MKTKWIYFIATITGILILLFGVVMLVLINKNSQCVGNPLVYGVKQIETEDYVLCSCQVGPTNFYFDKDGLYKNNPLLQGINITERG